MFTSLIFPGQGAQAIGMGKSLYDNFASSKEIAEEANSVLSYKLTDLMFSGEIEELSKTKYAQPSIVTVSAMILKAIEEFFGKDSFKNVSLTAGHSVGEYSALFASSVLSFESMIKLIMHRANFMNEACNINEGAMCAVLGLPLSEIETVINNMSSINIHSCVMANDNCPGQVVISGLKKDVLAANELLNKHGAKKIVQLPVSGAFHSPLMKDAGEKLKEKIYEIKFNDAKIPIISNVTSKKETDAKKIKASLCEQIVSPVRWRESIATMQNEGITHIYEIGYGSILTNITKRCTDEIQIKSIQTQEDVKNVFITQ